MYPRCRKNIKFISAITRYINISKILITLPSYQLFTLIPIWEYNIINHPDILSDIFEKNISLKILNNSKKKIRLANIKNKKKDIKPADINKKRLAIFNCKPQNRLLSKLSSIFKKKILSEFEFLTSTLISNT